MNRTEYEQALKKKRAEIEKQLKEELKHNAELRALFKQHPERRELYIKKLLDSDPIEVDSGHRAQALTINPKRCRTCRFSQGKPPFEDLPEKPYCMIYSKEEGETKPSEVYYAGGDCEFYAERKK